MFVNDKLQEFERYIKNKRVAIIGATLENIPIIDYFINIGALVTVFDENKMEDINKEITDKISAHTLNFSFGEYNLINLINFDFILRNPQFRPDCSELKAESVRGAIIMTELELFMELFPGKVIGVTGNTGIETTSKLIYGILKEKNIDCYYIDDNCNSYFEKLKEFKPESYVVVKFPEIYLLEMQSSPQIAVLTNTSSKQPDIYNSYEEYIDCEKNLFINQNKDSKLVLNYDDKKSKYFSTEAEGKVRFFSTENRLDDGVIYDDNVIKSCEEGVRMHIMTIDDAITIHGDDNYKWICAAVAATENIADPYSQARAIIKYKE